MGITQKYSLKWNDFTMNVASTFRDLHNRQDFVDVTLACADGSTLEAHKVILSSVSSYFRDILKTTPCKHPIIILKDTGRDEAMAMLEFAYTGEVNVAQELLPTLLHTARAFRIKGLDKVESPVDAAPPPPPQDTPYGEDRGVVNPPPPPRSHSPSSIHSSQDVKPPIVGALNMNGRRERSPAGPPSRGSSQPPTREASPCPPHQPNSAAAAANNARTPPPKRWKRSFDDSIAAAAPKENNGDTEQPLPMVAENYSTTRRAPDFEPSKRYQEPEHSLRRSGSLPYPHSMPTSPTMFERGNEMRLAGLIRHHLANSAEIPRNTGVPMAAHSQQQQQTQRPDQANTQQQQQQQPVQSSTGESASNNDYDPVDYRCFNNQSKSNPQSETEYPVRNGRQQHVEDDDRYRRSSVGGVPAGFRPESAPTVLDMSPEASLSGPPSVRNMDLSNDGHRDDDVVQNSDDLSDCVSKAFSVTPDAMGRYSCDECGKFFKHPGSLQHHRHIHRGTHRCPSCGKAFSRRWDMERHLNKSKYGCPANRFSTGSAGSSSASSNGGTTAATISVVTPTSTPPTGTPGQPPVAHHHLELLSAATVAGAAAHGIK